jgi:SAM-dependent methyltransferase
MSASPKFHSHRRAEVRDTAWWSPFSYVARRLRSAIRDLIEDARLDPGSRVLDYGCDDAPYRNEVPSDAVYVGADLSGNPLAEIELRPDGALPVEDASFDLILSTQVLEHVEDPDAYLAECFRVLRPGGSLVLSTHGIMYYHRDPEDYWRWMLPGLRKIVERAGFTIERTRGVMGLAATAIQLFQDATYWRVPRILRPVYATGLQLLIAAADAVYSETARTDNGLVIAIRAAKPGAAV